MEILIGIMLLIAAAFVAVILFILRAFKKEIWEKIKFKEVNMDKKNIRTEENLLKIINHYGVNNQLKHFQSEVWELNEAIFQYEEQKRVCMEFCSRLHCDKEREHIAEEIADVMVMLEQFKAYYGISSEEITEIFWSKVARQLKRMKEEK